MAKVRVYELARELGVEFKVILTVLKDMGEFVRSASSTIEPSVERRLKARIIGAKTVVERNAGVTQPSLATAHTPKAPTASRTVRASPKVLSETAVRDLLAGTPYSLPDACTDELRKLSEGEQEIRTSIEKAIRRFQARGLLNGFKRNQDYRLVHESNRLELEGPDLKGTVDAIESSAGQEFVGGLDTGLLIHLLEQDKDTYLALGLEGARVLAEEFIASGRPLSESSIRGLHSMIAAGESYAGVYRSDAVSIGGSEHKPPEHLDVPPMMYHLVLWLRDAPQEQSILRSAVAHAWLTHVHPFKDGNGRVARTLANIVLAQDSLPPAIVKAQTHRSRYLDVLSGSDPGSDILPVAGLFLDTLRRYAREMNKPRASRRLFSQMLQHRGSSIHEWFNAEVSRFLQDLQPLLFTADIILRPMDSLDASDFQALVSGSREKTMLASISNYAGDFMFMFLEAPTSAMRERTLHSQLLPSIGFALRNDENRLYRFRRAALGEFSGLQEVWLQTIYDSNVTVRSFGTSRTLVWARAVEFLAQSIMRAMPSRW